jgi:hypothetical protein
MLHWSSPPCVSIIISFAHIHRYNRHFGLGTAPHCWRKQAPPPHTPPPSSSPPHSPPAPYPSLILTSRTDRNSTYRGTKGSKQANIGELVLLGIPYTRYPSPPPLLPDLQKLLTRHQAIDPSRSSEDEREKGIGSVCFR